MHPAAIAGFCSELEKLGALKPSIRLQAHQQGAVEQSHTSPGMILNWGLGSGKTIGSMAVAEEKGGNVLVVVPASLRENYKKQLRQALTPDRHKHYTVISYNTFRADPEGWVDKVRPTTLVADEVHRLRNAAPREPFERVRSKIPFMLGLTGSLVNNDPEEIVPLTNLVAGKQVFKSTEDFDKRFVGETKVSPGLWARLRGTPAGIKPHIQNEEALGSILKPYIHRFSGDSEYQKHVPQVSEKRVEVEMTPRQEDMLKSLQKSNPTLDYKIRHNLPPSKSELKNLNAFMTGARQISNNPQAFSIQKTPSPKLEKMFEDLRESGLRDPNFKAVVYSNFLESGISPLIDALHHQGVAAESFTGGLNDEQRKKMVDRFNKGHLRVLGLSPAGGEGLDLKGVKMVQLTEEHWNPERTRQAVGRSARFKSHDALPPEERRVQVNRYLSVHPQPGFFARLLGAKRPMSPDEWIDERRREKLNLNQSLVNAIPQFQRKAAGVNNLLMDAFADELDKIGSDGTLKSDVKSKYKRPIGRMPGVKQKANPFPKQGEEKAAISKDMVQGALLGRLARTNPGLKSKVLSKLFSPIKALGGLPSIFGKGIEKAGPHELEEIRKFQKGHPKMASAFVGELQKLAYTADDLGGLGGVIAGTSTGRNIAGDTAAEMAPHGRKTRSESLARNLAWLGGPAAGMGALAIAHKLRLGSKITSHLMKHLPPEAAIAAGAFSHGAAGFGGTAAGGLATGAAVGAVQKLRGEPKGWENRKHGAAFSDELQKEAITHGKVIRAIFQRAYKGKQVTPTIHRMADTFSQTAERMGSTPSREGLKKWITQVKDTGKI